MRPRYLEIEGLQSFKELQAVDFDRLSETGLFGIFGPTGSGKSTILDAVTLALYGNVQRANRGTQGIINSASTTLRVSFTFDLVKSNERKTYKVERVYRRKKYSENSIESRVARLLELGACGDVVLADKQGEVNEAVIELIGLQFDDFTRSVVLPQNKFQEFLLAPKAEKTKMLERIFFLEEYGRELTEKVNRKLGRIRNRLSGIEGALSVLGDISENSLGDAEAAFNKALQYRKSVDSSMKAAEIEYDRAKEAWELSMELQEAVRKQKEQQSRTAEIETIKERCRRAIAAQSLADRINDLKKTETELVNTIRELERQDALLHQLSIQLEESKNSLEKAKALRLERIPILVEQKTKLVKARQTKTELAELEEILAKLRAEHIEIKKQVDRWDEEITSQKSKLEEALTKIEQYKSRSRELSIETGYRDKVQKGAVLEEELLHSEKTAEQQKVKHEEFMGIIREQEQELAVLEEKGLELSKGLNLAREAYDKHGQAEHWDRDDLLKAETEYYGIRSVADALKLKYKDIEQLELKAAECETQINVLERELSLIGAEKEKKDSAIAGKKLLLEELVRKQEQNAAYLLARGLKADEPCPVCGSTTHPHPAVLPKYSEETGDEDIKELQTLIGKLDTDCRALDNKMIKLNEQYAGLEKQKAALISDIRSRQEEKSELIGRLPEKYEGLSLDKLENVLSRMQAEKQKRLKAAEDWERKLQELERIRNKAAEEYSLYQVESSGKRSQLEANKVHLLELEKACQQAEEALKARKEAYDSAVKELGISSMTGELQRIQKNDREAESLYKELQVLENSTTELRKEIEKAEGSKKLELEKLAENTAEGRGFRYRKEEKEKEIRELLGDKDINAEIAKTEEEMTVLNEGEKKAQEYLNNISEKYEKTLKDKKVLEKQREIYDDKLRSDSLKLEKELSDKGFSSFEKVLEAFMPEESLEQLQKTVKEYEDDSRRTEAHKALIEKKLAGRSITEELWQDISRRFEELKLEKEKSIAEYESVKNRYETMKANYENWLTLWKELQELSRKKEHLEQFKNLLKGNGFIEYISEERLRYVAKEASETLGTLTRHRYGLELDTENGFVVRDDSNGGIRRLVTSLSGGETFLTSLALALALSSQIQLKGQSPLEFFFLDEGFGTLDNNLLDTVIDSLERLSTKERVIGLISHVPELKSRITRRLVVEAPVFNGSGSRVYIEKA